MTTGIELEIHQLLQNISEPALVADELLKRWHRDELSDEDLERVTQFLLIFGFHAALAENLSFRIKDGFRVPWSAVGQILKAAPKKPTKEILDQVFIGAGEQRGLQNLARDPSLSDLDSRFSKIRAELKQENKSKIGNLRHDLLADADRFHNDRLFEKEQATLERLARIYPDDSEILNRLADLDAQQASERLAKGSSWAEREDLYIRREQSIPAELKPAADSLAEKMMASATEDPNSAYDIAVGLHQMGQTDQALKALELAPEGQSSDWLRLELLLEAHRYVDVLIESDKLERRYASFADVVPAAMLARAKALWGLRQQASAIGVLENLIQVKPDYRSAYALLMHWKGGFD